jgi:hypothetical protein
VGAGVVETFDSQPVRFFAVFNLEGRVAIETLVFLEHTESHKSLWGDVRFVARAVRLQIRLSRQIQTPVEPVFTLIRAFLLFPFVISRLFSVGRFLVSTVLTFSQRPTFGVPIRTADATVGGHSFIVEVHWRSLDFRHFIFDNAILF